MRQNVFIPKKYKSLRIHKNPPVGVRVNQKHLIKGFSGIISTSYGILTWRRIETGRRFITRQYRRVKVWRQIGLTQPITAKSSKSRIGKGKGKFKAWVGYIRPGTPIYEAEIPVQQTITEHKTAVTRATGELPVFKLKQKFPFKVKLIKKKFIYVKPKKARKKLLFYTKKGFKIKKKLNFFFNKVFTKLYSKDIVFSYHYKFFIITYLCFNNWCSKSFSNFSKLTRFYHFNGDQVKTKIFYRNIFPIKKKFSLFNFPYFIVKLFIKKSFLKKHLEYYFKRKKRRKYRRYFKLSQRKLELRRKKNRYIKNSTISTLFSKPEKKRIFFIPFNQKNDFSIAISENKQVINKIY